MLKNTNRIFPEKEEKGTYDKGYLMYSGVTEILCGNKQLFDVA